jgi:hypothetical protein
MQGKQTEHGAHPELHLICIVGMYDGQCPQNTTCLSQLPNDGMKV